MIKSPFSFLQKNISNQGALAETRAEQFLLKKGLTLNVRNYQAACGEIDLIMRDNSVLVFIEVRLRRNPNFTSACESITKSKQSKIIRTANYYLQQHKLYNEVSCRFDVIAWDSIEKDAHPIWIKDAFAGS